MHCFYLNVHFIYWLASCAVINTSEPSSLCTCTREQYHTESSPSLSKHVRSITKRVVNLYFSRLLFWQAFLASDYFESLNHWRQTLEVTRNRNKGIPNSKHQQGWNKNSLLLPTCFITRHQAFKRCPTMIRSAIVLVLRSSNGFVDDWTVWTSETAKNSHDVHL